MTQDTKLFYWLMLVLFVAACLLAIAAGESEKGIALIKGVL